jgi:two-component system phosphate regulon sensor histidine kinase PhoR
MSSRSEPGRSPFAVRLFVYCGLAWVVLIAIITWFIFQAIDVSPEHRNAILLTSVLGGVLGLVVVALLARLLAAPLVTLTDQALGLLDAGGAEVSRSPVRELDQLSLAIARLDRAQRDRVAQAEHATETLERVLRAMPQGTILFSEEDEVVYANPSAQELLGAVPDTLSGLAPFSFQNAIRECRERGQPVERVADHGKPARRLRALATPFSGDDRILLIVVDVTDLDRVASIRRDFVANASHELKTPVSAIIASSEALQISVERKDDSSLGFAQQIERSARQLDRLVGDLLDLSRLEREQPELEPLSLDLLVREEMERLRPVADEKTIEITVELAPAQIAGSRRDIAIAVRNLLDNAVRYTGTGGSVGAVLEIVGQEVTLRISDTGDGIPTRDLARVFERFYRVDAARSRSTGGTGLGLAIVKHVVESHGGSVDVESELGRGSVFTVRLPVLDGDSAGPSLA